MSRLCEPHGMMNRPYDDGCPYCKINELEEQLQALRVKEYIWRTTVADTGKALREALTTIVKWDIPKVKDDAGVMRSYGYLYGSNGERDYMRGTAKAALLEVNKDDN